MSHPDAPSLPTSPSPRRSPSTPGIPVLREGVARARQIVPEVVSQLTTGQTAASRAPLAERQRNYRPKLGHRGRPASARRDSSSTPTATLPRGQPRRWPLPRRYRPRVPARMRRSQPELRPCPGVKTLAHGPYRRRGTTARHLRRNNDFPDAQGADAAGFRAAADARQLSGPSYRTEPPSSSRPGEPPGCLPGSTRR